MGMSVHPIHFNPVTGELMVFRYGRIIVEYSEASTDSVALEDGGLFLGPNKMLNRAFILSMGYTTLALCSDSWGSIKSLH